MTVGRLVDPAIKSATPVPLTTVHQAVLLVIVVIAGDGATIGAEHGSRVAVWVCVVRATGFAETASVLTVITNVPVAALSFVTIAVRRRMSRMRWHNLPL